MPSCRLLTALTGYARRAVSRRHASTSPSVAQNQNYYPFNFWFARLAEMGFYSLGLLPLKVVFMTSRGIPLRWTVGLIYFGL